MKLIRITIILLTLFLVPSYAFSQGGWSAAVASVQAQLDELKFDTVLADCAIDPNAFQDAVDAAPAAGAMISVSGNCDATVISAKRNLLIDGAGTASVTGDINDTSNSALAIDSSSAILITGLNILANSDESGTAILDSSVYLDSVSISGGTSALHAGRGSTVISSGVSSITTISSDGYGVELFDSSLLVVDGDLSIENSSTDLTGAALLVSNNSTIRQDSGFLGINGALFMGNGSAANLINGSLTGTSPVGIAMQRNSSLILSPSSGGNIAINAILVAQVSGGSVMFVNSDSGTVSLNGATMKVSRNGSVFIGGNATPLNLSIDVSSFVVELNSTLLINPSNFLSTPSVSLWTGSGSTSSDSATPIVANCMDDSVWVDGFISCAAP